MTSWFVRNSGFIVLLLFLPWGCCTQNKNVEFLPNHDVILWVKWWNDNKSTYYIVLKLYHNYPMNYQRLQTSDFQGHYSECKSNWMFLKIIFFYKEQLLLLTFTLWMCPILIGSVDYFSKNKKTNFGQWSKLFFSLIAQFEIQILNGL